MLTQRTPRVVSVGSGITRFEPGDRVVGQARGVLQNRNVASEGAFQEYTVLLPDMTSPIPDTMSFESAAVLPLGLSTAVAGLFQSDQLGLQLPRVPKREKIGKTLLVWGGSTSVGSNAIQLAVAAGYEVFTVRYISPLRLPFLRLDNLADPCRPPRQRTSRTSKASAQPKPSTTRAQPSSRTSSTPSKARQQRARCPSAPAPRKRASTSLIKAAATSSSPW